MRHFTKLKFIFLPSFFPAKPLQLPQSKANLFVIQPVNFLIIDIRLTGMDGITFLGQPSIRNLKIPKLLLSGFNAEERIFEALKYGATGYMFKGEIFTIDTAIDTLLSGEASITPSIALRIVNFFNDIENTPEESEPLTKRENEVLKELCEGYSIPCIKL